MVKTVKPVGGRLEVEAEENWLRGWVIRDHYPENRVDVYYHGDDGHSRIASFMKDFVKPLHTEEKTSCL